VAVLDYRLPDGNALQLLPRLKASDSSIPIIILTGHGSIDLAVEAVKLGATQFLTKPIELAALFVMIQASVENRRNRQKQLVEKNRQRRERIDPFLGRSAAIRKVEELANKVAGADSPVLIQGETGTGKGVLTRWIHAHGQRAAEPFLDLNCGGLSHDLLETELFGHEKGAFTGAFQNKVACWKSPTKGLSFSMKSETWIWPYRGGCSRFWKKSNFAAWEMFGIDMWIFA
jgi:DNA-binding NtrC family response regulator